MRVLFRTLVLALVTILTVALLPNGIAGAASWRGQYPNIGDARQVILVEPSSKGRSWAKLTPYDWVGGRWRNRTATMEARIGWAGFWPAATRRQNSGTTPSGIFRMYTSYGSVPNPGTKMPYRRFDRNDWWVYDPRDPRTYNSFQIRRIASARWRTSWAEHLWKYALTGQYRYFVPIDYNQPRKVRWVGGQRIAPVPADIRGGGGIFLHVRGRAATAGCVAIWRSQMLLLMRWLDPAKKPRIMIGPGMRAQLRPPTA